MNQNDLWVFSDVDHLNDPALLDYFAQSYNREHLTELMNLLSDSVQNKTTGLLDLEVLQCVSNMMFRFLRLEKRYRPLHFKHGVVYEYDKSDNVFRFAWQGLFFDTLDEVEKAIANPSFL